jgi:hypothetical protein
VDGGIAEEREPRRGFDGQVGGEPPDGWDGRACGGEQVEHLLEQAPLLETVVGRVRQRTSRMMRSRDCVARGKLMLHSASFSGSSAGAPAHPAIRRTGRLIDLETHETEFPVDPEAIADAGLVRSGIDETGFEGERAAAQHHAPTPATFKESCRSSRQRPGSTRPMSPGLMGRDFSSQAIIGHFVRFLREALATAGNRGTR